MTASSAAVRGATGTRADLTLSWGAATHRGLRRTLNEDSHLALSPAFFVADGMGGHDAGEVASAVTVEVLGRLVRSAHVGGVDVDQLRDHLGQAQDAVRRIESSPGRSAGTTLAGAVVTIDDGVPYWLVANIGDSRVYHLAGGVLEQVSVDHSEVQELVDAGLLARSDAAVHPRRHVVTRALGADPAPEPDFWFLPIVAEERLLVCSDGLCGDVPDERIADVLLEHASPQCAADALVQEALDGGGRDNVTVVVIDVVGETAGSARSRAEIDDDTVPRAADRRTEETE